MYLRVDKALSNEQLAKLFLKNLLSIIKKKLISEETY